MATLGIVLTRSPMQHEAVETAYGLASAALDKGHGVQMFCYIDGVYGPMKGQEFPDMPVLPRERFMVLLERGAQIMCCGLCVNGRGIDGRTAFVDGTTIGMLPDLANLVSDCDRVISL